MNRDPEREPEATPAPADAGESEAGPEPTDESDVVEEDYTEDDFAKTESPGPPLTAPPTQPFDPAPPRERIRGILALGLTAVFAVVVLGSPLALVVGAEIDELKSVLEVILPPVVALTGTAIGFYFGGGRR